MRAPLQLPSVLPWYLALPQLPQTAAAGARVAVLTALLRAENIHREAELLDQSGGGLMNIH